MHQTIREEILQFKISFTGFRSLEIMCMINLNSLLKMKKFYPKVNKKLTF